MRVVCGYGSTRTRGLSNERNCAYAKEFESIIRAVSVSEMRVSGAKTIGLAIALAALVVNTPRAMGQTEKPVPQEAVMVQRVNLVLVDVQVLNKKTRQPVESLKPEDFAVYEDGVQQRVVAMHRDELPLSVVFLFDLTDSVQPVLQELADGAVETLQHLKPEDEVAVMVYAASAKLLQDFTKDRGVAVKAIERAGRMHSDEAAFFNEGVYKAALEASHSSKVENRRVIIWLTDNVPNIPSEDVRRVYGRSVATDALHTEHDAEKELLETDTTICTLLKRSEMSDDYDGINGNDPMHMLYQRRYPPGDVYKYADETGGMVVTTGSRNASERLAALIEQVRARYNLGYLQPNGREDGKFCRIQVEISPYVEQREGKLVVRAREGYYRKPAAATTGQHIY